MRRAWESERGAAAVELALVLPLLLLVLFGIIEFSRYYNAQLTLQHASREGVRTYAITRNAAQGVSAASTAIGSPLPTPSPTFAATGGSTCTSGTQVRITGTYTFTYVTPAIGPIGGTRTITAVGVMRCGG